jgi:hypothetical protein
VTDKALLMTAPTPERARALLELVEEFLLKRRSSRTRIRVRERHHRERYLEPVINTVPAARNDSPEEIAAWRKALKGPR